MADIEMITPVRAESFKQMIFDAGMLLKDFDYASATDAATLAQLIATEKEEDKEQRHLFLNCQRIKKRMRE